MSLETEIASIRSAFLEEVEKADSVAFLETLRVKYLGKKGPLTALLVHLKNASPEERPKFGKLINDLKEEIVTALDSRSLAFEKKELNERLKEEWIDATLPGRRDFFGRMHPVTQLLNKALDIFINMGFSIEYAPILETDYYNFEALNFEKDHPARDMQDTFYITKDLLLRTQTSNAQVRTMERSKPPLRTASPGRCFRNENISQRSHVFFHQIEGFVIDKHATLADLFSTMEEFLSRLFGQKVELRIRPSYFPFVEPGVEVDVSCTFCDKKGCRLCKYSGWLEIGGAGMVHPNVLRYGGIDPEIYTGYAWGFGIERLALLFYQIPDIRMFTENDMRFLEQFP